MLPFLFAFQVDLREGHLHVAAEGISILVLGTEADPAVGDALDVQQVAH